MQWASVDIKVVGPVLDPATPSATRMSRSEHDEKAVCQFLQFRSWQPDWLP